VSVAPKRAFPYLVPSAPTPVPLAQPDITPLEVAEVMDVLRTGRLALGPKTAEFESLLAEFAGVSAAAATSSGTAGLQMAVRALGIGSGDCVITSSFSFIASANCIRYEGAEPVFLDIDPGTLCLSPRAVESYLGSCRRVGGQILDPVSGSKVKAILAVDAFGHPADWEAMTELARTYRLKLIGDSCEALGSTYRHADGSWVQAGSRADLSVVAFYPNKQITTGEGGAVLSSSIELIDRIRRLRNHGRRPDDPWLHHEEIGFNFRMNELSAAVGVAQMRRIEDILGRRQQVADWYTAALGGTDGLSLPQAAEWASPAWFVYFVRVDAAYDRDALVGYLCDHGVESKAYFEPPIHLQPPYEDAGCRRGPLSATEDASRRTLILPFSALMSLEQVTQVVDVFQLALREVGRSRRGAQR
jgi:perosamine synthetase